ncbi:MAG: hypothetical protein JNL81_16185 [Hyphomonadaceae bacterium]|nr:hypothetical protein [Hyphomonadaceae bacterium]
MAAPSLAALRPGADVKRITSGVGEIRERTIEIGDTVVAVNNIGAITLVRNQRSYALLIVGGLLAIFGLIGLQDNFLTGVGALAVGAVLIWINLMQKVDKGLSIGTCDGRSTLIVSTNEQFLNDMLEFIRRKVDTENIHMIGRFDIKNEYINSGGGGVALGDGAIASGDGGNIRTS